MSQLTVLCADKNNLASLPEVIEFRPVKTYHIIPRFQKIGHCQNLQVVELQQNCLTFLPDSMCLCTQLTEVIVSNNLLQSLPNMIGQLSRLTNLRVDNNQLTRLPDSIGQ